MAHIHSSDLSEVSRMTVPGIIIVVIVIVINVQDRSLSAS